MDKVLAALRECAESDNGNGWWSIYLDNAKARCPELSARQWAGYLSALEKAGVYKPVDNFAWGDVKMLPMWEVAYTDCHGSHRIRAHNEAEARKYFDTHMQLCVNGQIYDMLLIDPTGNFVDTWGT